MTALDDGRRLGMVEAYMRERDGSRPITPAELEQRESLKARLATRPRPTREDFNDLGAPMLDEKGG